MPTGYTSEIYDGKQVTVQDYIMKCARAFGVTVLMRDEPMDAEIPVFKPNRYYKERLEEWEKRLEELQSMTSEEAERIAHQEYTEELIRINDLQKKSELLLQRYENMMLKVIDWKAPTTDHEKLKEFCIEQLRSSIGIDCDYPIKEDLKQPTAEIYLQANIETARYCIDYYEQKWNEETTRANERNQWAKALKESF